MTCWNKLREQAQWTLDLGSVQDNAAKTVFPGPVVQMLVAAAAWDSLGRAYRFTTKVMAEGSVLTLVGGGDPTLTYEDLRQLAAQVKAKGIDAVTGPIRVDDSLFDDHRQGIGWFWDQESLPDQAQVGALSVEGNLAEVCLTPRVQGQAAKVDLGLAAGYLTTCGSVLTGSEHDPIVERVRGTNRLKMGGTIAGPIQLKISIDDPAIYTGYLFASALREAGVTVSSGPVPVAHGRAQGEVLACHESASLHDILVANPPGRESYLLYEHILRSLAVNRGQTGGSEQGLTALAEFLTPVIGSDYRLMDGAGMARYNLLSAEQVRRLLGYVAEQQPDLVKLIPQGRHGRLITYHLGDAAGIVGYRGERLDPTAVMGFGFLDDLTPDDLLKVIADLNGSSPAFVEMANQAGHKELLVDLNELLNAPQLDHGVVGLHVVDLENGEEIGGHLSDAAFTPASNTKLFTAAAGLHYLGSHYCYQTPVYYRGEWLADGTLVGDLVVKGVGDPCIGPTTLDKWAQRLVSAGLRTLDGQIVVDDTVFSGGILGKGWLSSLEVYGYSPQISSLSYHGNVLDVTIHPGAEDGQKALLDVQPLAGFLSIDNQVTTGEGREFEERRLAYRNHVVLRGKIPKGHDPVTVKATVEDPAVYLVKGLYQALSAAGVRVRVDHPVQKDVVCGQDCLLFTHSSPKLSEIVKELNKHSDNFLAEMLIRTVGLVAAGEGSAEAGIGLVHRFLDEIGMTEHPYLTDGSGLTRHNLITPRQITTLLRHMAKHSEFAPYYDSLPIAGIDGTLRNRMKDTLAQDNVRAKTGTMSGVSGLSGYVRSKSGRTFCFSILMNGYAEPGAFVGMQNKIAIRLAEE